MVSVLRKVPEFRGDSRFTTWACTFAIREVAGKIGRHVWRRDGVRFDDDGWDRLPAGPGGSPAEVAEGRELVAALGRGVSTEPTEHQRLVFVAIVVHGTPLDTLAIEVRSNRNALYKTMFDARRKLPAYLVRHGHLELEAG